MWPLFIRLYSVANAFFTIYKHLRVGIEVYNKDGILIDQNDKELEMFYLNSKEEILGINVFDNPILPEEVKEKMRKHEDADFTFRYDLIFLCGRDILRKVGIRISVRKKEQLCRKFHFVC